MYASTLDGSNVRLENFQDRIQQWRQWLYGKDLEGQTLSMGRTVKEWGEICPLVSRYVLLCLHIVFDTLSSLIDDV